MTSTYAIEILGSVGSLLAATLYQENTGRNHRLWDIVSTERYILHIFCWNVATYKCEVRNGKIVIISFVLNRRGQCQCQCQCQCRGVGQGMMQTQLYMSYSLFQSINNARVYEKRFIREKYRKKNKNKNISQQKHESSS